MPFKHLIKIINLGAKNCPAGRNGLRRMQRILIRSWEILLEKTGKNILVQTAGCFCSWSFFSDTFLKSFALFHSKSTKLHPINRPEVVTQLVLECGIPKDKYRPRGTHREGTPLAHYQVYMCVLGAIGWFDFWKISPILADGILNTSYIVYISSWRKNIIFQN